MMIALQPISVVALEALAESRTPAGIASIALDGSLPPGFVARRSLDQLAQGKPWQWCSGFYMLRISDHRVVGSCGFKDAPASGRIEIGYGVAPLCRNQGLASSAVRALLRLAFASESVREVLAQVNPSNLASIRVVTKLGFKHAGMQTDRDGEVLVQWVSKKAPDFTEASCLVRSVG